VRLVPVMPMGRGGGGGSNKTKVPKGWQAVQTAKPRPEYFGEKIYTHEKLGVAMYEMPTSSSAKEIKAAKISPIALTNHYCVHPQPPDLPRFWEVAIEVQQGVTPLACSLYYNISSGARQSDMPRMVGAAQDGNAPPPLPPRTSHASTIGDADTPPPVPVRRSASAAAAAAPAADVPDYHGGDDFDEDAEDEELYTQATDEHLKSSSDAMSQHPFVVTAEAAVVVLAGVLTEERAPEVDQLVDNLKAKGVKLFPYYGDLPAQYAGFMPEVLKVCSSVVVACNDSIHSSKSQVINYLRFAKAVNQDIVLAKISSVDMDKGEFGLLVSENERFNIAPKGGKSEMKRLVAHLTKIQKSRYKNVKKSPSIASMASASPRMGRASTSANLTQKAMTMKMSGKTSVFRNDLYDSIVLLYSWGRKGPDNLYQNQEKVLALKQELQARGFKVWVDVDHIDDHIDDKDAWEEEVVTAITQSALVICCVTNTFHIASRPVQEAFLLAVDCKVPGESIFGIKLSETADMRCGSYGLYMQATKYYDFSTYFLGTPQGDEKITELSRDIRRIHGFGDGEEEGEFEELYGELDYVQMGGKSPPQVKAAEGGVMLSYGWGKRIDGVYPSQRKVLQLSRQLQRHGFKVWLDLDHMMGNMDVVMAGAIEKAAAVVACCSIEYVEGPNAQKEWIFANQHKVPGKTLIAVSTSHRPFTREVLFKTGKGAVKSNMHMWGPLGGPDALLNVTKACDGLDNDADSPGFIKLCEMLEAAGVHRQVLAEPSLANLEKTALRRRASTMHASRRKRNKEKQVSNSWFVGVQEREVLKKLFVDLSANGDYLVRESKTNPGALVVVNNDRGNIRERKIARDDGKFIIKSGVDTVSFNSMEDLLRDTVETTRVATQIIERLDVQFND